MATPLPRNEASFTLGEVAELTGGALHGDASLELCGVFTDSRRSQPAGLFVALRGERFDGHEYAASVDAAALLVEEDLKGRPHVRVSNTLEALGALGQAHRLKWGGTAVAITGSVGKTTTKAFVESALRSQGLRVRASEGNLNNFIGVPMSLFTLNEEVDVAVIEAGTNAPGEIEALGAMILPELAVITAVRTAHTEGLGSVDAVGVEKRNLLLTLGAGDSAVLPADDLQLSDAHFLAEGVIADAPFERIRFGEGGSVFVKTHDFALVDGRPVRRMELSAPGGDLMLDLRSVGFGAMRGAAAAVAVLNAEPIRALRQADAIDTSALRDAFEQIESTPGRMQLRGRKHLVIDDSYNASPASMEAAIDDAAALAALVRRPLVLMLGPMGELGELSAEAHANVLKLAVASGGRSVLVADEYVVLPTHEETGRVQKQSVEEAIAFELAEPSVVLVKASRSARLERVADALSGGVA